MNKITIHYYIFIIFILIIFLAGIYIYSIREQFISEIDPQYILYNNSTDNLTQNMLNVNSSSNGISETQLKNYIKNMNQFELSDISREPIPMPTMLNISMERNPMTTPYQTTHNKTTPYQTTPYQTTPNQTTPYQTTPNQTTPNQTTPNQTTPYQTTPNQTTPNQTTPNQTTPNQTTPMSDNTISPMPDNTTSPMPDNTISPMPDNTISPMPDNTTPYQTTPYQTTPYQTTPYQTTPYQTTPYQTTPYQTTPNQTTPYQTTPYQTTPNQTTPYQTTPNQTTPNQTTPNQTTPYQTTPYSNILIDKIIFSNSILNTSSQIDLNNLQITTITGTYYFYYIVSNPQNPNLYIDNDNNTSIGTISVGELNQTITLNSPINITSINITTTAVVTPVTGSMKLQLKNSLRRYVDVNSYQFSTSIRSSFNYPNYGKQGQIINFGNNAIFTPPPEYSTSDCKNIAGYISSNYKINLSSSSEIISTNSVNTGSLNNMFDTTSTQLDTMKKNGLRLLFLTETANLSFYYYCYISKYIVFQFWLENSSFSSFYVSKNNSNTGGPTRIQNGSNNKYSPNILIYNNSNNLINSITINQNIRNNVFNGIIYYNNKYLPISNLTVTPTTTSTGMFVFDYSIL